MLIDKIFDEAENAWIAVCGDFNADFDEVPVEAIRGEVENTGNGGLARRVMLPCEMSIPKPPVFHFTTRGNGGCLTICWCRGGCWRTIRVPRCIMSCCMMSQSPLRQKRSSRNQTMRRWLRNSSCMAEPSASVYLTKIVTLPFSMHKADSCMARDDK